MRNELERTRRRRKRKRTERRVFISVTLENIDVHQWSSGKIVPCHGTDPGSIPGWCKLFVLFYYFGRRNVFIIIPMLFRMRIK